MRLVEPMKSPRVRGSTDDDIRLIHEWLVRQDSESVEGTFLCNWNLTLKEHASGELLVYVGEANEPLAYQWGGLIQPGILEVRNDMRGKGIGRVLVAHRLAEAQDKNEDILFIQCKPSESIPFWKSMGFEVLPPDRDYRTYAYRIMPRALELPDDGEPVKVEVQWFPEKRNWQKETPPLSTHAPSAVRTVEGEIFLAERIHCFDGGYDKRETVGDVVVRILVNDDEVYCGKARYDAAEDVGVESCRNGFFVDWIYTPVK